MSTIKIWGWDKKPRTMLRFIKPGDIFCLKLDQHKYSFGIIVSKIFSGHVAEFFDKTLTTPKITESQLFDLKISLPPQLIDTYALFDKKIESGSDWRIIGHHDNYNPENMKDVYFVYGLEGSSKKIDIFDNETNASTADSEKYPRLNPLGDYDIKLLLKHM
ncbi:immunity 26/phosphotriesterase HocA family protein [Pseudomonas sp. CBS]|uniref:immunity 26/phosphotriesterase HocA family protein n=1 Tax=Pseudomonas TaxID=286 RepID=UPI0021AC1A16|nr:immunity 26/phosphotriesterase HocA family protein [Pseudomonas sp. CBS]WEL63310.1 immunity 26/phosphotriesterase HocA family protein [Pseudomonas sp. CBSPGW29]WEL72496.1 immunity 26/phosphotriesterase HocA family protein [Pseudomonas sp. CBSPCGW29]WEL79399.1 immunity 26/phosphotriesterase HocA family protein [Pseudomonas sp. CBSPAW29]WEL81943.1 immunity 26/phosphotriesterase HocA family protein [Pseudomonas sp. CBSPCAW29]WEL90426.1 immunity 26/phosphotriesterase HocA family protein [Pseudo